MNNGLNTSINPFSFLSEKGFSMRARLMFRSVRSLGLSAALIGALGGSTLAQHVGLRLEWRDPRDKEART